MTTSMSSEIDPALPGDRRVPAAAHRGVPARRPAAVRGRAVRALRGQPDDGAPGAPGPRQRAPARPAPRRGHVRRAARRRAPARLAALVHREHAPARTDAPRRASSTPAGSSRASRTAPPSTCRSAAGRSSSSGCASPTTGRWPSSGSWRRRRAPAVLDGDLEAGSLHTAFERLGRIPTRAQARVSARPATDIERRLLGLDPHGVVLSEKRTIDDQDGTPDRAHRDAVRRRALRVRGGAPAGRRRGAVVTDRAPPRAGSRRHEHQGRRARDGQRRPDAPRPTPTTRSWSRAAPGRRHVRADPRRTRTRRGRGRARRRRAGGHRGARADRDGRRRDPRPVRPGEPARSRSSRTSPGRGPATRCATALAEGLGMPVAFINDARAHTLAEARMGAGRGASTIAMLTLGTGIGGGLVIDGKLHLGATGTAGEIGHQTVHDGGRRCGCGNRGCAEPYAQAGAMMATAGRDSVEAVFAGAAAGDERCQAALDDAFTALGIAIGNIVTVIVPGSRRDRRRDRRGRRQVMMPLRAAVERRIAVRPAGRARPAPRRARPGRRRDRRRARGPRRRLRGQGLRTTAWSTAPRRPRGGGLAGDELVEHLGRPRRAASIGAGVHDLDQRIEGPHAAGRLDLDVRRHATRASVAGPRASRRSARTRSTS